MPVSETERHVSEVERDLAVFATEHKYLSEEVSELKDTVKEGFKLMGDSVNKLSTNVELMHQGLGTRVKSLEDEKAKAEKKKEDNRTLAITAVFTSVAAVIGSAAVVIFEMLKHAH